MPHFELNIITRNKFRNIPQILRTQNKILPLTQENALNLNSMSRDP
jgi:hypothetical protein